LPSKPIELDDRLDQLRESVNRLPESKRSRTLALFQRAVVRRNREDT
jgi:hypothetical protein